MIRLPNWIGDAVMVLPAVRSLPREGQIRIGVAHPRALPVYEASGLFDTLLPARGASAPIALRRALRALRPRRALVFTEALSGAWLARVSGAPERLGWAGPGRAWGASLPPPERDAPLWRSYLRLAAAAGGSPPDRPDFRLEPGNAARERARQWLEPSSPWVALAPGASYGPSKQWPLPHFERLVRVLRERGNRVVTLGSRADREAGAHLATAGALDLTGRTTLLDAVAVLAGCRAAVTNDSGSLHLARAAGTPVVGVFGSSSPRWTGPEPWEGRALWLGLDCSPCFRRTCPLRGADHLRCLRDIDPGSVADAVESAVGELA